MKIADKYKKFEKVKGDRIDDTEKVLVKLEKNSLKGGNQLHD